MLNIKHIYWRIKMNKLAKHLSKITVLGALTILLAACGGNSVDANAELDLNNMSVEEIAEAAQKEGEVNSVGMPDTWANWKETWEDLSEVYELDHTDTDMSSAEELATF